jgi:hypothetical protein
VRSTARKRARSKEHADDWLTPKQQLEQALALIQPTPEEREACAGRVSDMRNIIEYLNQVRLLDVDDVVAKLRRTEGALTQFEARVKDLLSTRPESLLKVIVSSNYDSALLGRIKTQRECMELVFDEEQRSPLGRRDYAKQIAAACAWLLLGGSSGPQTGLTANGPWHKLSAVMFGYAAVDLFNFDYLKDVHLKQRKGPILAHAQPLARQAALLVEAARRWLQPPQV